MLERLGLRAEIFHHGVSWLNAFANKNAGTIGRLKAFRASIEITRLSKFDLFVVCDTMGALFDRVSLDELRAFGKPILLYEVFYAGGSSYWKERIPEINYNKFDGYLVVSGIHDMPPVSDHKIFPIGMQLPLSRDYNNSRQGYALLDFERDGYEGDRKLQIEAIRLSGMTSCQLHGEYSFSAITSVYREASVYFVAFFEAFGVPIVELQYFGAYVAAPSKQWVMRHALLPSGSVFDNNSARFSNNFIFYEDVEDLMEKLQDIRKNHNPNDVRSTLLREQPEFCHGDLHQLWKAMTTFM
jgi:hypothetical protein